MDVQNDNPIEVDASIQRKRRDQWIEQHARQVQQLFQQWQHPIGIDGQAYQKHLEKELTAYWDDPLLKTLIESI
ncbi:MAG: hypothetical protein ACO21J_09560 [Anaerohalosphaeraceae bacterium]|jgi:hypothetical protein